jgi:hypothetical protein
MLVLIRRLDGRHAARLMKTTRGGVYSLVFRARRNCPALARAFPSRRQ